MDLSNRLERRGSVAAFRKSSRMYLRDGAAPPPYRNLPTALIRDPNVRPGTGAQPRLILAGPSKTLEQSFSGTSFYMAQAGIEAGVIDGCVGLQAGPYDHPTLYLRGAVWSLAKRLSGKQPGGFKFSPQYSDAIWSKYMEHLAGTSLVNNFQIYGDVFLRRCAKLNITANFYIDGTLHEYFESYRDYDVANVDASTMEEAMHAERDSYAAARRIAVMSRRCAQALQDVYSVPRNKIHVVIPGANIPDRGIERLGETRTSSSEFVLGFVGLYPYRKGLDRLANAVKILRSRRVPVRLRVIGECPVDLQGVDGIDYLGRIDKTRELERFVDAVSSVHLGCLLSRAELAGISVVEFLRFGVPILATDVGGTSDILEGGGSIAVESDIDDESLASVIDRLISDSTRYDQLRTEAQARIAWASWRRAMGEIDAAMA